MKEFFKKLLEKWKIVAGKIAAVQTVIILFVIYFTIFLISALISSIMGKDLLSRKKSKNPTFWKDGAHFTTTIEEARRQF